MEEEKIKYEVLATKGKEFIKQRKSFQVWGLENKMSDAVAFLEKTMEEEFLTSRVYLSGRSRFVLTWIPMIVHNIATYDPDYEIAKCKVDNILIVTYKRTPKGK